MTFRPRSHVRRQSEVVPAEDSHESNLHYLLRFERLLAGLSARFVNLPPAHVDDAITDALRQIVLLLDVDRCQLIRIASESDETEVTHSWAVDGVAPVSRRTLSGAYPWVIRQARKGQAIVIPRVDDLPPEAAVDKASFQRAGARSNLTMPLRVGGEVEGAIALGCLRRQRDWPADLVDRIGLLATVFGNALAHKRAQEALDAALEFELTVSGVLAALLTAARSEQDRVIEASLRDMARVFGSERATLWQRVGEGREFTKTHRWLAEGVPAPPVALGAAALPWISAQVVRGEVVRFARRADLPPEAAGDLPVLQALHIRAGVIVPISVMGAVVGALSFATAREDRQWHDPLVQRVKLVGDVFAGLLARQAAERREQEAQAQAAHAARVGTMGAFAASLVHELTQPLAASLANAETASDLLAARSPDLDELRATVADIVADDRRASELIQQLRRFLRRGQSERRAFDARDVIDEALRVAGNEAIDKRITVKLDAGDALPKLVGDRVQVQQVLLNLLLNAFDAVAENEPASRHVAIVARSAWTGVNIEVTDAGCGMDEATLARAFEPFFTTKPGGMGLGLSISRTIVAAHGGMLSVRSAPGRGTSFRIELPTRPQEEVVPVQPVAVPAGPVGTVFVVEDEASMRRAIARQLQSAGHQVEAFDSAQDFLDGAPRGGVACIVSDMRMPGLSGLDLQAFLAKANRDVPIVFISGHGDIPTSVDAMRAGAVNFLPKPFTKGQLLAAVGEALERSRGSEHARRADADLNARYQRLTPRERDVFALVSEGLLNKVIADRLGAAETTIKIHRGRVMQKMNAESVADLVRMAERLGLHAKQVPAS